MSWTTDGNYWTPTTGMGPQDPRYAKQPVYPITIPQEDYVFKKSIQFPPWVEAGTTFMPRFSIRHYIDGAITQTSSFSSPLTIAILDRNANPYTLGVTLGTVTADAQASGVFYSLVTLAQDVAANDYIIQWSGSYTPQAAGSAALPFLQRVTFKVNNTTAPSQYFMWDVRKQR